MIGPPKRSGLSIFFRGAPGNFNDRNLPLPEPLTYFTQGLCTRDADVSEVMVLQFTEGAAFVTARDPCPDDGGNASRKRSVEQGVRAALICDAVAPDEEI